MKSAAGTTSAPSASDARAHVRPLPQRPHDEEADERDPEEDRVRRVHDREHEARSGRRRDEPERRRPHGLERQRERGRHEELPRRGRGQREEDVGAAHPRGERDHRHLRRRGHARSPGPPEERPAGLEGDEHRERREDRRKVRDDPLRILARELRDERDEAVPERERVPGMQAAVGELRDTLEREVVELEQLPRPREVEQPVALHRRRRDPQEHADDRAPEDHPGTPRNGLGARASAGSGGARAAPTATRTSSTSVRVERRADRERDRQRAEHGDERPGEARRRRCARRASARAASPARGRPPSRTRA